MANTINKGYTMVMRKGTPKMSSLEFTYTLMSDDYNIVELPGKALLSKLSANQIFVHNMQADPTKGLTTINGALSNYTLINVNTNMVDGEAHAVVLNRVESNGKLVGYTIFNTTGVLQEVSVKTAVEIDSINGISNGKVRHTQDGDIISAIGGTYPLRTINFETQKTQVKNVTTGIVFIGSALGADNKIAKYAGVLLSSDSAVAITKLYPELSENNKKVISTVRKIAGADKNLKSLEIIRTGNAGFYGIFSIDKVFELISTYNFKIIGDFNIACLDYSADGTESNVTVNPDLKITNHKQASEKSVKALKIFADEVITKLRDIKH